MKLRSGFQILIPAAAALCFAGISVFLCSAEDTPAVSLSVSGVFPQPDAASAQVHMTYIDWDHSWYLFLPASADRAHLTVSYEVSGDAKLLLNQQEIISGTERRRVLASDILPSGALLVRNAEGATEELRGAEISLRLTQDPKN